MSRQLVYRTEVRDAVSQLPVVIIDASVIKDGRLPDPETEVPEIVSTFPVRSEFVIVFFASRAPKTPQLSWLRRVHGSLPRDLKKRVCKVYIVHAKWYTRALNKAVAPIVSPKFAKKTCFIKDLTELSHHMDITAIDINPVIFYDDAEKSTDAQLAPGHIPVPKQTYSIFGRPLPAVPTSFWRAAFTFLKQAEVGPETFQPLAHMDEQEFSYVSILKHAVAREQKLRLYDYGPPVVLAVVKKYLLSLPEPLIDVRDLPLPLKDTFQYVSGVVSKLPEAHITHLEDIISYCSMSGEVVDIQLMSRSIAPAVAGIRKPNKEHFAIASRFIRTLIEQWSDLTDVRLRESSTAALRQPTAQRRMSTKVSMFSEPEIEEEELRELTDILASQGQMPRELPSEVLQTYSQKRPRVPNRKAFGRVAEIMKIYDENHTL